MHVKVYQIYDMFQTKEMISYHNCYFTLPMNSIYPNWQNPLKSKIFSFPTLYREMSHELDCKWTYMCTPTLHIHFCQLESS